MKFFPSFVILFLTIHYSQNIIAGVFKCTDNQGNTSYQSSPCAEKNKAIKIDVKTGGSTDLGLQLKRQALDQELITQKQAEQEKLIAREEKRKKDSAEQSAINQQLIKNNPIQFSAYAIPPYSPDKLSDLIKKFEARLPEIERLRRLAAQKALATGECIRVEDDQLNLKSTLKKLVFSVDCSTAKTFYFNESELLK